MYKRIFTHKIAALALFTVVGLVAALAIAWPNVARAHSPGSATLTALTVTAGGTAQTLTPAFSSTVTDYTVAVVNSVAQVTVTGTPDGDGTVAYQNTDGTTLTDADMGTAGQQVDLPTVGSTSVNVVVSHTDSGTTTQTYTVLVIREGTVATDRAALMVLYNSTRGAHWKSSANWGSDRPIGEWHGVTTDGNGRVTRLNLDDNQLTGDIPPELGDLSNLMWLYLDFNQLTGEIPPELGGLPNLEVLYLRSNQLTGEIPPELGGLSNLEVLFLHINQLTGEIPTELGDLSNLTDLRLYNNLLTGKIPPELGDLSNLTRLDLDDNGLMGEIPPELGRLSNLMWLYLDFNQLTGKIPPELGDLSNLKGLYLHGNRLTGEIPPELGRLSSLTQLYLRGNKLSGCVPDELRTGLTHYDLFALDENSDGDIEDTDDAPGMPFCTLKLLTFSGEVTLNPEFTSSTTTYTASAAHGVATTTVTARLNNARNTVSIMKGADSYTSGTAIPLGVGENVIKIEVIRPSDLFTPHIYTVTVTRKERTDRDDLVALYHSTGGAAWDVNAKWLSDRPIDEWHGVTTDGNGRVIQLELRNNGLRGEIPPELGRLSSLTQLYLRGNKLSGCVPDELRTGLTHHDFIAVDANDDGDTEDAGDTPGLPFCTLSSLTFSGDITLNPVFTSNTTTYTASAAHDVQITTVRATRHNNSDTVSIMKGTDTPTTSVPLDVGSNVITIKVTRLDDPLTPHIYTVDVTRAPNTPPTFDEGAAATRGVDENTPADTNIGELIAATDDDNDTLTYSLDDTSAASFDINESSGQLRTKADLDHETKRSYTVTVSVRDSMDANGDADAVTDDMIRVTIQVANLNEDPVFTPIEPDLHNVDENTPAGRNIGAPVTATDPEDNTLTYSLDVPSRATFNIVATTGQLQTSAALNFEGKSSYTVTVTVADPSGANDTIMVTITVNNVEEEGTVTLSSTQPIEGTLLTATLDDPDVVDLGSLTWSWRRSQNRTSLGNPINGATLATYTPVAADVGRFLRATASYTDGEASGKSAQAVSTNRVQAAPVAPNEPPVFNESPSTSRDVDENTVAGRDIGDLVTATDPEDNTLTYSLDVPSRATFNIVATTGQLQTSAALNFEGKSSYTVIVTATDPSGADDTITVTITVGNVEEEGTVTLSSTQPIEGTPLTATLDDPDNVSGSVTWSWRSSPNRNSPGTLISGETSATYTPVAADVGRFLRATASYTDGERPGKSAQAVSTNRVQAAPVAPNEPPVFNESPSTSRNVAENTPADTNIGAPVTATDPEDDPLTYSLDVPSRATFDIVATTGQLLTKADLDHETTATYSVTVTATDTAGGTDTITVNISVNNVDEPGTVTLSSTQPQVRFQLTATLDDPDDVVSGSVTWLWAGSPNGSSSSWTTINGATSATYTPVTADVTRYLRATASYTDGEDSDKSAQVVSANRVQPAPVAPNDPPIFVESPPATRNVDENTSPGEDIGEPVAATDPEDDPLTYSLDAPSRASFDIVDTTGQLRTRAALDYETRSTYTVTVTAADPAGAYDTITVTIDVNNLDEPGTVTLSSQQPLVAIPLTATLDELDAVLRRETWLWERSPNGASDWTTINGETSDTYTPVAGDVGDYLRATAAYTDEAGPGKSAQAISANWVEVAPGRNKPVLREHPTATRSVARNTPAGRDIGAPFSATDADNDALTYSLGGRDRASFDLDRSSGQLLTKEVLTGIDRTSYEVMVSVSDSKDDLGNPDTAIDTSTEVTITVTASTTTTSGGGGGGGGGGSSRSAPTPTPTPTPSPTPTATPTPTGPQFSGLIVAEPSVSATVVPEGTTLGLNGGGDLPGGVYVNFPPTAVALPVHVSVSVSNTAPDDVTAPSGTTLLPLTINITPETPLTLGTPLTIEINPTPEQLAAAGGDLNNLAVGVVTPNGIVVLPTQIMHGRLVVTIDHLSTFVLLAVTDSGPVLTQPPMGDASSMGPLLQWTQPPRTTWFQVQVIPFNEDGPGINLVIGDGALVRAAQYQVLGPNFGSADPNYVMLPGMTYLWRVRTATVLTNPTEADWSGWAVSSFKTPPASSSTITPVAPQVFGEVGTLTPTLTWANSNTAVFYYEVQVSRDFEFGPNAFLYSEYVHGGASTPANSYVVPEAFPLEAGAIYYWRVRPGFRATATPCRGAPPTCSWHRRGRAQARRALSKEEAIRPPPFASLAHEVDAAVELGDNDDRAATLMERWGVSGEPAPRHLRQGKPSVLSGSTAVYIGRRTCGRADRGSAAGAGWPRRAGTGAPARLLSPGRGRHLASFHNSGQAPCGGSGTAQSFARQDGKGQVLARSYALLEEYCYRKKLACHHNDTALW